MTKAKWLEWFSLARVFVELTLRLRVPSPLAGEG
jgi:hypothetical protein